MRRAIPCPCCRPRISVRRMSRSSVPCRCALYRSDRFRIDILPEYDAAQVEYQPERRTDRRGHEGEHRKGAAMWKRRRPDSDFSDEIRSHLDHEADRLIAAGMRPEAARRTARRAFGSVAAAEERYYQSQRARWLDHLRQDVRGAVRGVARYPVATFVAIVSLAFGIGAMTTTLMVRDVVFRKPPRLYRDPAALSLVLVARPDRPGG